MPESGDPLMLVGQTISHYRISEQIGAGGMGVVYRARDERLDRDVAVKVLPPRSLTDPATRQQLRKEALTLSKLNHTNIAIVFDFDTENETDFLVTEYVPGITLDAKLAGSSMLEPEVLRLGVQLAAGLEAAHREASCIAISSQVTCELRRTDESKSLTSD
jgi:eukaryotic-like serine/threonine-protein kinase